MEADDLRVPDGISERARRAIEAVMRAASPESGGGCRAFYTPEEWAARGEEYGARSVLVVCHDGGDLAPFFNWDYGDAESVERMRQELEKEGLYAEQCTSWYSAIYPTAP